MAAPAITYAEQGIVVSPAEHRAIENHAERLGRYPASAAIFLPGGAPLRPGDILRQTDLARSLALIARGGPDAFYRGEIALAIESFPAANGGALTADDFADHTTDVSPPLATSYRGYTVYETGLPTPGFVVLEALNICEQAPIAEMGLRSAWEAVHTEVSALRLAFADRLAIAADPDYVDTPVAELISKRHGSWSATPRSTLDSRDDRRWQDRRRRHHLASRPSTRRSHDLADLHPLRDLRIGGGRR